MMENSYSSIVKVCEVSSAVEANKYLELGWVLLGTYTECYDTSGPLVNHQDMIYSLGWHNEHGDIEYPKAKLPKYGKTT